MRGTKNDINQGVLHEQNYPSNLKQLNNLGPDLYYQGDISLLNRFSESISIVGTRTASIYGKTCTQMLVKALSVYNSVIVSGMAYGIDCCAHEAALEYELPTIAVLGVPLEAASSNPVYQSILKHNGLIISEYPPGYQIGKWSFRERNRIISALSFCTVIVEAPQNSGALITAEFSKELKRDIYALVGDLTKSNLAGNFSLINSAVARPIFSAQLWAESLELDPRAQNSSLVALSNPILDLISAEPLSFDTLIQKSQVPEGALLAELSKLITQGRIRKVFGQRYIRL